MRTGVERLSRRPVARALAAGALALGAVGGSLTIAGPATSAVAAEKGFACSDFATPQATGTPDQQTVPPDPFDEIGIPEAKKAVEQQGRSLGGGINIAIVDSGFGGKDAPTFSGAQPSGSVYHGTTVAGLIGEIAPNAQLIDLPVYKPPAQDETTDEDAPIDSSRVANALGVLIQRRHLDHLIVNLSLHVNNPDDPELRLQVERLIKGGAIVVAATGNAADFGGSGGSDDPSASPSPDADYAGSIAPAKYPGVVAVGASLDEAAIKAGEDDISQYVLPNSRTDVVAPTYGARSTTLGPHDCFVNQTATSWSTAEVTGILALVKSAYPTESGKQIVARLIDTATGRPDEHGRFWGAGVVQAYDAVTRPLAAEGSSGVGAVKEADVAPPAADVLRSTRHDAVWWGLIGGGALLLGLVLRPLVSRRK